MDGHVALEPAKKYRILTEMTKNTIAFVELFWTNAIFFYRIVT